MGTRLDGIVYGGESNWGQFTCNISGSSWFSVSILVVCLGRFGVEKRGWEDAASRDPNPTAVMELYKGVSIRGCWTDVGSL